MSQQNLVNVTIPAAKLQTIKGLVDQLKTELAPFVITLTNEERMTVLKLGDKSVAFVNKVKDYAISNPEFVPPFLSVPDLVTDITAVDELTPILRGLEEITSNLDDTVMLSGSEAFVGALMYYNGVKLGDKTGIADAKLIYEELKKRFPGRTGNKNLPEPPAQ
jgi:hypothetical protein